MKEKELLEKYKDQKFNFESYFKYGFVFQNENANVYISGDTYRVELRATMTINEMLQEMNEDQIEIVEKKPDRHNSIPM